MAGLPVVEGEAAPDQARESQVIEDIKQLVQEQGDEGKQVFALMIKAWKQGNIVVLGSLEPSPNGCTVGELVAGVQHPPVTRRLPLGQAEEQGWPGLAARASFSTARSRASSAGQSGSGSVEDGNAASPTRKWSF